MLNIRLSNRLDVLARQLAGNLLHLQPADPMASVSIIIPNRDTARWLSVHLAESTGIAANLDYQLPSEWIWNYIRILQPDLPEHLPSDREPMTWSLYELLREDDILSQFENLNLYLSHRDEDLIEQFRWQLAEELAGVFDQYLVYRPEMMVRWEKKEYQRQEEKWQGKLWKLLVRKWNSKEAGKAHQHRAHHFQQLIQAIDSGNRDWPSSVHLFNPGLLAQPYLRLISKLQNESDIYLYQVHPCEQGAREGSPDENSSELMNSFGMEAAQIEELLEEWISDDESRKIYTGRLFTDQKNNLTRVQESVMHNKAIPALGFHDESIVVRACHSPLREVETLHQFLLNLFDGDSPYENISPDEVLVVSPDLQTYTPFIKSVFGTREEGIPLIPFHLPASAHKEKSGYLYAFRHLLHLPESRFGYHDVMEFIQHSVIRRKFQFSDSDISVIKNWIDDNRVIWGLDAIHRREFQQPLEPLQTWTAAIQRIWTGQLTGGEPGEFYHRTLLYHGVQTSDEKLLWARFHYLLRQLSTIKDKTKSSKRVNEWCDTFKNWITFFLPEDHPGELKQLLDKITGLQRQAETAGFDEEVPYSLIRSRMLAALDDFQAGSAFYTRGVVFSSMVPVKSIPFKVIALLGLNDDHFPRRPVQSEFDLMAQFPEKGERNRPNEDRNLFLESIMAAKDVHYCSFIGRDQKDDKPIPPSPILKEWMDLVNTNGGKFYHEERLNGYSEDYFKQGSGISKVYFEVASSLRTTSKVRGLQIRNSIKESSDSSKILSVKELETFLKNPVKYFFTKRLGVYLEDQEEDVKKEFSSDILDRHILFQYLFGWRSQGMGLHEIEQLLQQSGSLPAGWPGEKTFLELVEATDLAFSEITGHFGGLSVSNFEIDQSFGNFRVEGTVQSYLPGRFLDIHPSKVSGTHLLVSWFRYLLLSVSSPEWEERSSHLIFGLRDAKPEWLKFREVEEPDRYLTDLFNLYKKGMEYPLTLFPKSAWVYTKYKHQGEPEKAHRELHKTWGGKYSAFPERSDPYITLWLGEEAELKGDLQENFEAYAERVFQPLYQHLEGIS
ncbi:MAG: exodeoxyribonuclease V subunit gamma [Balneolaceae bacterium]